MADNHKELRELLDNIVCDLILTIGKQVTDAYAAKQGLWEGMSINNEKARHEATQALTALLTTVDTAAKTRHLTDLSRAVGILDGLGYPDEYLNRQREKLLATLRKPTEEKT